MIVLDYRERALASELPGAETRALDVGDALICGELLIERKTPSDLASSIRDGRWRDQLARLVAAREAGMSMVAIVLEGDASDVPEHCGVAPDSVRSALVGAYVRDGIPHFVTRGPAETARLLSSMAERLSRNEGASRQSGAGAALLRRNAELSDPRVVALYQLSVVPGVSASSADAILGECGTISEWLRRWGGRAAELADTVVGRRRLGPAVAGRILRLCGAD